VASFAGELFTPFHACSPDASPPAKIKIYDRDSLDSISTTTAPPCLSSLIIDPVGDGFIAVHGGKPGVGFVRIGLDGLASRSTPASLPSAADHGDGLNINGLVSAQGRIFLLLFRPASPPNRDVEASFILGFDAETFEPIDEYIAEHHKLHAMGVSGVGRIIVADDRDDRVTWMDPLALEITEQTLLQPFGSDFEPAAISTSEDSNEV
jgi:hypothetical protein